MKDKDTNQRKVAALLVEEGKCLDARAGVIADDSNCDVEQWLQNGRMVYSIKHGDKLV